MWKLMLRGSLAAVLAAGCAKDKNKTGTPPPAPTASAKSGLDVSLNDTGQADVYITDEQGNRVDASGATGRIELPDGSDVPLTPSDGGRRLTAPLGEHMRDTSRGCGATVRVTPPSGGGERVARLDMCRGRGPGQVGPGMGHGEGGEMGGGMQHQMGPQGHGS